MEHAQQISLTRIIADLELMVPTQHIAYQMHRQDTDEHHPLHDGYESWPLRW